MADLYLNKMFARLLCAFDSASHGNEPDMISAACLLKPCTLAKIDSKLRTNDNRYYRPRMRSIGSSRTEAEGVSLPLELTTRRTKKIF